MPTEQMTAEVLSPVQSDVSGSVPLAVELEKMSKKQLVAYADAKMGLTIDEKLTKEKIIAELVRIHESVRKSARDMSEASARASISDDDPAINVVFFNMQSADEDITFNFPGPRGMRGAKNPTGHAKCPTYHLFPGMEITLPFSVVEHLRGLTYLRHKAVFDPETGEQKGAQPIITPRFILEQRLTKEEAIALQKMRK